MIRIITDSTADLLPGRAKELGVEVLPLSVNFGEQSYRDGVELSAKEFYEKLAKAESLPTTSQINPDQFVEVFEKHLKAGDQVLGIFLSSDLSGTFQSAVIALDMVDNPNVKIVDSRTVTFALGLVVEEACRLRDEGLELEELAQQVQALTDRIRILAVVDTLKYLKMGGRISATTAVVGGLLGISPIIAVENGKVESAGKARGRKAALVWIAEELSRRPADLSLPVAFGHSNAPEAMAECKAYFAAWAAQAPLICEGNIGAVVGTHAGPGATGVAYFEK